MNPREALATADAHVKAGKIDEAIAVYREVAGHYREQNFLLKAFAVYKQMLVLGPERADLRAEQAEIAKLLGLSL